MKKYWAILLLFVCMMLTACQGKEDSAAANDQANSPAPAVSNNVEANVETVPVTARATVQDLKRKYNTSDDHAFMPFYNVPHDQEFIFHFKFNPYNFGLTSRDLVTVHTDIKALPESEIHTFNWAETRDGVTSVSVKPGWTVLATKTIRDQEGYDWGTAPHYYIRISYDMDAEEPVLLDEPIIIPFTVKSEVPVPNLDYEIDRTGRLILKWNEVEGAEYYRIYKRSRIGVFETANLPVTGPEEGYAGPSPLLVTETTETTFDDFLGTGSGSMNITTAPDGTALISQQNMMVQGEYYVTAVAGDRESNFSRPVNTVPLSKRLPYKAEFDIRFQKYPDKENLPTSLSVVFIDGSTAERNLIYDPDNSFIENGRAYVKYRIEGTALNGILIVEQMTEEELVSLSTQGPQEVSGFVMPENTTDHVPNPEVPTIISERAEEPASVDDPSVIVEAQKENTRRNVEEGNGEYIPEPDAISEVPVNADTALEEYLALHLMDGSETISLKAFPEAQNFDTLSDVFGKVLYQNPLILGVNSYGYNYGTLTLHVNYDYPREEMKRKQEEIIAEANRLVKELFRDGMSEQEKHFAIYQYLNDHTVYDDAALENGQQNNFLDVDPQFYDSFNAYGIMVKKVGVCASYAAAYKMLSDLAGLESVVVTGMMSGIPHAWNKVKINDIWVHIDATNNETNVGIPYLLYQSSDAAAEALEFYEDKQYWLDAELHLFAADDDSLDYYVVNDLVIRSAEHLEARVVDLLENIEDDDMIVVRVEDAIEYPLIEQSLVRAFQKVPVTDLSNVYLGELGNYLVVYWQD